MDRVTAAYDLKTIISAEKKPRVLAVDDQRDALRLLQIRLQNAGFDCLTANDGASAIELLAKEPDGRPPTAHAVAEELRRIYKGEEVPPQAVPVLYAPPAAGDPATIAHSSFVYPSRSAGQPSYIRHAANREPSTGT